MRKILLSALLSFFLIPTLLKAQTPTVQDCLGAIPVCLNTYNQYNGYTGVGNYNDIPAASCPTTCMSAGERNSVWYTFTVQTTGWFDLRITPWVMSDDYDWALFNMTTAQCSDLNNTSLLPQLEVSCNWSADGGITGANTLTPNTGVDCWGSAATANNPRVWVTAGQTYYLNISNYTGYGAGHGYQLDMTHSTATIYDNVRPYLLSVTTPLACGATSISITMSENVLCSSVSAADFTIAGYTVTAVSGPTCAAGGTMENNFTLTVSPALNPGTYTLCINGSAGHISDLCGNLTDPANPANCKNFTVSGVLTTLSASPNPICAGQSTTLTAGGSTSYSWSHSLGTGTSKVVTPASTTTYTVTGTTGACTSTATVTVNVNPGPAVSISASANPICAGQSTTLTASGATSYSWSGGLGTANPLTVNPLTTTTYTVTGTTGGCTGSAAITITVNPIPSVTLGASPNPICLGASSSLTAGGASSYSWSGGIGPGNPVVVSPGSTTSYTVTGTTGGCTNSAAVTVTVNPSITITLSAAPNPICAGASSTLTAGGATSYSWSGGLGTGNPKVVSPGSTTSYTVTGTDGSGCTGSTTVTVTVNPVPTVTVSGVPASICPGGSSTLTAGGATSYSWSGGLGSGNPVSASPATTTVYTVTGTTAGCTGTASVSVNVSTVTANAGADVAQGACASSTNTLNGSGTGAAPLGYSWSPATGLSNPGIANPVANPATTTTYTLMVTSAIGCTATDAVVVTVNTLTANAGADGNTGACASSTYTLNGSATGVGPFNYAWTPVTGLSNPGIANPVADPASTTTYTLTVTDSYGCTASDAAVVNVATVTANAGSDGNTGACASSTFALGGSGTGTAPLSYSWSPAAGLSNPAIANPTADPAATTTYTLTVTDAFGCTATDAAVVNVAPLPTANAGSDATLGACASAPNTTLNGTGTGSAPLSYTWTPVTGLSNPAIPNPVADPAATTNYTLTVSDSYGCTATDNVVITVDPMPTANAGADGNVGACGATGYNINGSGSGTGPLSYSWSPVTGLSNPAIANPVATPAITTTYTLTVTDSYGCTATDAVIVSTIGVPVANAGPDGNRGSCASSTYTLNGSMSGSAPLSYSWTPAAGLSSTAVLNPVATPAATTTYTLTVTDGFGCTVSDAVTVTVAPLPTSNAGPDGARGSCTSSVFNLSGSGSGSAPLTYSWTPAAGLSNTGIANPVATPAATTTYTLTVTDSYGCSASDAATVTVEPLPTANAGSDAVVGACAAAPSVTLNGSGTGTAPLSYSWSPATGLSNPALPGPTAHPTATTSYTLTVTDAYGCTASDNAVVTVDPLPTANAGPDGNVGACGATGYNINGSGSGTGPFIYSWSPTSGLSNPAIANPVATPAASTTYTLTVTDAYGCTGTDAVLVNTAVLPVANAGTDGNIGSCPSSFYNINGSGSGAPPLFYSWTPATGLSNPMVVNPVAQPSATTTYTLTVTDAFGCTATDAVIVNVSPLPTSNAGPDGGMGSCATSSFTLNGAGTGQAPLTYSWTPTTGLTTPGSATTLAQPTVTTAYTLTVTDPYGCSASDAATVSVYPLPTVNAGADATIGTCPTSNAALNGSAVGSNPFTYTWTPSTGLSNPNISNPSAHPNTTTTYTLTVTDTYGCTGSDALVVTVDPAPSVNAGPNTTIGACPSSTTSINGTGTGTGITWSWSPAAGLSNPNISNPVANPSASTTYVVTVTDIYGCTATDDIVVSVSPLPAVTVNPANPVLCNGGNVNLSASGAVSYAWNPTGGLSSSTGANVNAAPTITTTYTVVGTDAYGCTAAAYATVSVNPTPVISIVPASTAICAGGSVNLTASGATTYTWTPAGGLSTTSGANTTASPGTTVTYTVTGTSLGCNGTNTVTVTVHPLPNVNFGAIPALCNNGNAVTLNTGVPAGGIYSGNGVTGSSFNPLTAGPGTHTITYTYTDINNCTNTAVQNVTVYQAPTVSVSPANATVCLGNVVNLTASGATNYTWAPPAGLSGTTGTSVAASPAATSTYVVTGETNGCTNTASVTVTVVTNIPITIVPANPSICPGSYTVLTATGAATYTWAPPIGLSNTSGSSVAASPTVTTTYTVTGDDGAGCTGTATATVNIYPNVLMNFMAMPVSGCPPLEVDFTFVPSPLIDSTSWSWNFGDPDAGADNTSTLQNPSHTYYEPDIYIVTLSGTTTDGCAASSSDTITLFPAPVADFIANPPAVTMENPLINFIDQSLGAYYWDWNFGDPTSQEFNVSDLQNPDHLYGEAGEYTVTLIVENMNGCTDTAIHTVEVIDAFAFFIPNAFSPNGDYVNELFIPLGVGFQEETFKMRIFDRWGQEVYYTEDIHKGWDGTSMYSGKLQPQGIYSYIINVHDDGNFPHRYIGSVTLLPSKESDQ